MFWAPQVKCHPVPLYQTERLILNSHQIPLKINRNTGQEKKLCTYTLGLKWAFNTPPPHPATRRHKHTNNRNTAKPSACQHNSEFGHKHRNHCGWHRSATLKHRNTRTCTRAHRYSVCMTGWRGCWATWWGGDRINNTAWCLLRSGG